MAERQLVTLTSATGRANPVGYQPCQGVYIKRQRAEPQTAFIATHYNVDFSEHYLGPYLAERGFGFLGWNTRFRGAEAYFQLEHALIDIGAGVRWLVEKANVERVVLLGNSGGGSLMAAYQSQATQATIQAAQDDRIAQVLAECSAAHGYVALNAHPGRPEVLTTWLDPSITDERDPLSVDPALDMYNPANGPPFSEPFIRLYRSAQAERNQRITDWCKTELARLAERGVNDRLFNVFRSWADLRMLDPSIDPSERQPGVCYAGDPKRANYGPAGLGMSSSCRSWINMWSLETSECRGAPHLNRIAVPSLVLQSNADTGVYPSDAEAIYSALGSADKRVDSIPGDHYLQNPGDARDIAADYIADWAGTHLR